MLRRLVGPETYARALDLYFERHDGQACTIEDWLAGLRGRLRPRPRRSSSAGTPRPAPRASPRPRAGTARRYSLDARPGDAADPRPAGQGAAGRSRSPTASSTPTAPPLAEGVLELDRAARASLRAGTCPPARSPSLLRGFSAPVILERDDHAGRARLPARPRQRPLQQVGGRPRLRARAPRPPRRRPGRRRRPRLPRRARRRRRRPQPRPGLQGARARPALRGRDHRPHRRRRAAPPTRSRVWRARRAPRGRGRRGARRPAAARSTPSNAVPGPYSPDAAAAGHRALRARALGLLTALDPEADGRRGPSSPPPTT